MATVDKNFRIKNGLVVEGSTATVNGNNILTENTSDEYIVNLIGGSATRDNTANSIVLRDGFGNFAAGQIDLDSKLTTPDVRIGNAGKIDVNNNDLEITSWDSNNIVLNANQNVIIQTQNADIDLRPDGGATIWGATIATQTWVDNNYDTAGSATTAQQNAQNYADSLASNYDPAGSAQGAYDNAVSAAASDATTKANTAEQNAKNYADGLAGNYDAAGSATTAENNAKSYTDQEIAALVDSAPAMLDTLNELAAAIADNPNYASDVTNLVATKADTTYVDNQISGVDSAAQGYATTAENNAKSYADGLAGNYDAAGAASTAESNANTYTNNAVNDLTAGNTTFTELAMNWSRDISVYQWAQTDAQVTAYSFSAGWASAKFLVRVRNGSHSQVSEILITRDNSNNIAITEYGIVTTNGILGDITAAYNAVGNQIEVLVTPTHNDGTEIIVHGTIMAYGD